MLKTRPSAAKSSIEPEILPLDLRFIYLYQGDPQVSIRHRAIRLQIPQHLHCWVFKHVGEIMQLLSIRPPIIPGAVIKFSQKRFSRTFTAKTFRLQSHPLYLSTALLRPREVRPLMPAGVSPFRSIRIPFVARQITQGIGRVSSRSSRSAFVRMAHRIVPTISGTFPLALRSTIALARSSARTT